MSSSDYDRLYNNIYTKTEVDTLIENNSSNNMGFVTEEQLANISNGSFTGLPIGYYWTIFGDVFRIMAHDQFYGYNGINKHHIVVMQDTIYGFQKYNDTDTNSGGYSSSILKNYIMQYNAYITIIFGDNHVLSHTHDLTSGTYNSGTLTPTANTKAWLINSYNVDGIRFDEETIYNWQTADKTQFPAFKNDSNLKIGRRYGSANYWWLSTPRSINSKLFCYVASTGTVAGGLASNSYGVRPAFLLY